MGTQTSWRLFFRQEEEKKKKKEEEEEKKKKEEEEKKKEEEEKKKEKKKSSLGVAEMFRWKVRFLHETGDKLHLNLSDQLDVFCSQSVYNF